MSLTALSNSDAEAVSDVEVQAHVETEFGLTIPRPVFKTILKRAARDGLVRREHGVYKPVHDQLAKSDITQLRTESTLGIESLIAKLQTFLQQNYDVQISSSDAETVFLDYVADRAIPMLRSSVLGETFAPELLTGKQYEYVIGQFLLDLEAAGDEAYAFLDLVVKGSILASAVYLSDSGKIGQRIRDLTVLLDTPFVISLMGLSGEPAQEASIELITLLASTGAQLACFEHTLTETQNVIVSAAQGLQAKQNRRAAQPDSIISYCIEKAVTSTELEVQAERLEEKLKSHAIAVVPVPAMTKELSIDEKRLGEILQSEVGYRRESTRNYDANSISGVFRLRRGMERRNIETAKAIFATPNVSVAIASSKFFNEPPRSQRVPVSIVDHELGTIAWLKQPVSAPDLPRKQLLADCYASTNPGIDLWEAYLDAIDRLEESNTFSEDDYLTLRFGIEARRSLMHVTRGDPSAFTDGTIVEVLNRAKQERDAKAEYLIEQQRRSAREAKQSAVEQLERSTKVENDLRSDLVEAKQQPRTVLRSRATRRARRLTKVGLWVLVFVFVAGSLVQPWVNTQRYVLAATFIASLAAVLGIVNYAFKFHLGDLATRLSKRIEDRLYARYLRQYDTDAQTSFQPNPKLPRRND